MRPSEAELELATEFRRVLALDPAGTDFFVCPPTTTAEDLRRITTWLRALPSGLSEAELERRIHEEFGEPPA